jgi:hypothetical protein
MSKYKVTFARIVNEGQLVEAVVEGNSEEEAYDNFLNENFVRFLVMKREMKQVTPVGKPEFKQIAKDTSK